MKIALIGYGKMGHMIENIATKRGNEVVATVDYVSPDAKYIVKSSQEGAVVISQVKPDVVIDFTHPDEAFNNIKAFLPLGMPIVVGTTGWTSRLKEVEELVKQNNNALFYAGNFSIGVNMFYRIIENASRLMAQYDEYDSAIWEAHHNQKADSPSGTALDIAKYVMKANPKKTEIVVDAFHTQPKQNQLHVSSTRVGNVPGTHTVFFDSNADSIELTHRARNREGFALGAVRASEWLYKGISSGTLPKGRLYTMDDLLSE